MAKVNPSVAAGDYEFTEFPPTNYNVGDMFLPSDYDRVAFIVQPNTGQPTMFITTSPDGAGERGISVVPGVGPFIMRYRDFGALVGAAWYFAFVDAEFSVSVISVSYKPNR